VGYNAAVVVLLDRLDEIERDQEFGKKLVAAIRHRASYGDRCREPYVTGQTQVVSVAHADTLQVIAVGGNTGRLVGVGFRTQDDDELIRDLERERRRKKREAASAA